MFGLREISTLCFINSNPEVTLPRPCPTRTLNSHRKTHLKDPEQPSPTKAFIPLLQSLILQTGLQTQLINSPACSELSRMLEGEKRWQKLGRSHVTQDVAGSQIGGPWAERWKPSGDSWLPGVLAIVTALKTLPPSEHANFWMSIKTLEDEGG